MEHITTYTGEDFTPLSPSENLICIEDIAHALSMMCRANGHFVRFYSVAQHSINCAGEAKARGLSVKVQIACLLHDASEASLARLYDAAQITYVKHWYFSHYFVYANK